MNINDLITIVKKKIKKNISLQNIDVEDKTFLHKNHKGHDFKKFHVKLIIKSSELKKTSKIQATKKIYLILKKELNDYIHSIQILIN
jgi:BolA protein